MYTRKRIVGKLKRTAIRLGTIIAPKTLLNRYVDNLIDDVEYGADFVTAIHEVPLNLEAISTFRAKEPEQKHSDFSSSLHNPRVWRLSGVVVHSSQGVVFTQNQRILRQSIMKERELRAAALYGHYSPETPIKVHGTYATIGANFNNYSHWITESLTRLYILKQSGAGEPISLIIPDNLAAYQIRSLKYILPRNINLVPVPANSWISPTHLLLPEFTRLCTDKYVPIEILRYLRNSIFEALDIDTSHPKKRRIYISRSDVKRKNARHIINESEVIAMLKTYDFEIIHPAKLEFEEQVRVFSQCEIVVGTAGSGLSNIIYCTNAKVLELQIFPPQEYYYWRFSQVLRHTHQFFPTSQHSAQEDFLVEVPSLERAIQTLIA